MKNNYEEKNKAYKKLNKAYKIEKKTLKIAEAELMLLYATQNVSPSEDEWENVQSMLTSMGDTVEKTQTAISKWIKLKNSALDDTEYIGEVTK